MIYKQSENINKELEIIKKNQYKFFSWKVKQLKWKLN